MIAKQIMLSYRLKFALKFISELTTARVLKQVCAGGAILSRYTIKVWQLEVGVCLGSRAQSSHAQSPKFNP